MNKKILILVIAISVFLIASCALGPFMADMFSPDTSSVLKIDASGAKAVAGIDAQSRSSSKGLESKDLEDNPMLVKFLEDGTIASIIETETDMGWTPNVAFITTGEDGSIYVGFDSMWWIWTGVTSSGVQFLRIYPDSTEYDVLWPPSSFESGQEQEIGQISVWGWWGMEQDPLVKGADGKLYFKVETWNSNGGENKIFRYDPDVAGDPIQVTPENATLTISTFMIDAKQHLFFQSEGWDQGAASYLRYYTGNQTGYKTVYYSSEQDTWIRGYVTNPSGDFLIINGQNIRGMNGIIKVYDLDNDSPSYQLMYSNANGGGSWIELCNYTNDSWENNTELIDRDSDLWGDEAYEWRDDVKDDAGNVDIDKIIAKISPYFYDTPSIKSSDAEDFVTGPLNLSDGDSSVDSISPLYQKMCNSPAAFLTEYFNGQLFSDWLQTHNMTDLYFDNIGTMLWASDDSLYGLYDSGWWNGGSETAGTKVVKLLDSDGNRDLEVVALNHGEKKPSAIKIEGDFLYYRYAVLDGDGQETGLHQLARLDITSGVESEILPADLNRSMEIVSYDTSSNNNEVYFVGANPQTNEMINGKIDIASGTWTKIDTTFRFGNIKVIE